MCCISINCWVVQYLTIINVNISFINPSNVLCVEILIFKISN